MRSSPWRAPGRSTHASRSGARAPARRREVAATRGPHDRRRARGGCHVHPARPPSPRGPGRPPRRLPGAVSRGHELRRLAARPEPALPEVHELALAPGPIDGVTLRDAHIRERFGVTVVAITCLDGSTLVNRPWLPSSGPAIACARSDFPSRSTRCSRHSVASGQMRPDEERHAYDAPFWLRGRSLRRASREPVVPVGPHRCVGRGGAAALLKPGRRHDADAALDRG